MPWCVAPRYRQVTNKKALQISHTKYQGKLYVLLMNTGIAHVFYKCWIFFAKIVVCLLLEGFGIDQEIAI